MISPAEFANEVLDQLWDTCKRPPNHIFTLSTVIVSPSIFPLTVTFFP